MMGAMREAPFFSVPEDELLRRLGATPTGLTEAQAAGRRPRRGGRRQGRWGHGALRLFLAQLRSPLVLLLLGAMALSLALHETTDALIVLCVIALSTLLGFFQEHRAAGAVARLLAMVQARCTVLRDGSAREVPVSEVVPGDVVELRAGDAIPGDSRILSSRDLFVDEAALTGESYPAEKAPGAAPAETPLSARACALYQGTHVISGTARAVVVATGEDTEFGALAARLAARPPETEFERGLRRFGEMLIRVTLLLVLGLFAVNVYFHRPVVESLLFALALAVGLTPELLPAIVSVTLSSGAQRMAQRQVIVRRLLSIENFGSMDVLCSDKTGTLTERVVRLTGALGPDGSPSEGVLLLAHLNAALESGFLNPIDAALREPGLLSPEMAAAAARHRKVDEVPYDFVRKRLSIVVAEGDEAGAPHTMITKGALQNVLAVCDRVALGSGLEVGRCAGEASPLSEALRQQLLARYEEYSGQGRRVLGMAVRDVTGDPIINKDDEAGMNFVGFLLFEDPPKPGIDETVAALAGLGVRLVLVTGDNRHVAAQVMRQVRPLAAAPRVLTGAELLHLGEAALRRQVEEVDVFAELEPSQKERILRAFRQAGHVVGYLGDGINDAAALHAADVGISVDTAVDVAKEAADIVLLAHDLRVLLDGVREGRRTFANTLKYIYTTTSANFGNMLSMAGASLLLPFLPLLPKQILLNNLLSDVPSLAVAADRVDEEQIARPRRWDVVVIRRFMIVFGLVSSAFDLLTFATLRLLLGAGAAVFQTGWFIESLMTELFITLIVRTGRPLYRSRPAPVLSVLVLLMALVTLALPYSPLAGLFGLVALRPGTLLLLLGITLAYMAVSEVTKAFFFRWALSRRGDAPAS
jgi:Mg2+-importing ATPase